MDLGPGARISHYRLLEKLGEGGMGQVYRAWDERLERAVAIKLLGEALSQDRAARANLLREARIASALNHPHICVIHEVSDAADAACIVMELVEGSSLSALIPPAGLPLEAVSLYGIQVADALAHAHERGVIHRDLKSGNVVVTPDGRAKVLDFGLATRRAADDVEGQETRSLSPGGERGTFAGTLAYLPPEVLRGEPADERGDLWALAVMLHEMAAGTRPFPGRTSFEVTAAILREAPLPLGSRVPAGLRSVILRGLAKEPAQRYQRAGEMRAALEAVRSSSSTPGAAASARPRRARRAGKIRALAVLPLENLSGDPAQDYFADGMTEALIGGLAKIGTLRVISRTSAMAYKGIRKPLPEIARELRVDAVVEGSVLRAGDQVRITAQLVRAATDEHLWAETYDRPLSDILALQSEVACAIAQEIRVKLTPGEAARLGQARQVDPAAYEAYLRGRFAWNKRTETGVRQGIVFFDQAIERDPTYALAFAGLADCNNVLGFWGGLGPTEAFGRAKAAASRALELDGDLAEAHSSLAYSLLFHDWAFDRAERGFLRAIELNPGYATGHHFHAMSLLARKRGEDAAREMRKAEELDPLSQIIATAHGWILYMGGDPERAAVQFRRALEMHPGFWIANTWLGLVHARQGRFQEGIAAAAQALGFSDGTPLAEAVLGNVHGLAGDREAARRQLDRLEVLARQRYVMPYGFALVHAGLGDLDAALDRLEEAAEERGNLLCFLAVDPSFEPLHGHPRFEALRQRIGLPG